MIYLNSVPVKLEHFFDNTQRIKLPVNDEAARCWMFRDINSLRWNYESDEELFALYAIARTLHEGKPDAKVTLTMPYVPNARMDRVMVGSNMLFTLKYFCEIINLCDFYWVSILDPHSPVTEAMIDRVVVNYPITAVQRVVGRMVDKYHCNKDDILIVFPDAGAAKRYTDLGFDTPYITAEKHRDLSTGKIQSIKLSDPDVIAGKSILIVDDICCKGGTFMNIAEQCLRREDPATNAQNISLYVSHCENTIFDGDILTSGLFLKVFTTNSILTKRHALIDVMDAQSGAVIFSDEGVEY